MPNQTTKNHELTLTGFHFPEKLENSKAYFRFVVDLRYVGDDKKLLTEQAVMPSLDTFWECDTNRQDRPNYVRDREASKFHMQAIDPWDRLILRVQGDHLHAIQFKVFDIDRKDGWDKVKGFIGEVLKGVIGLAKAAIPQGLPLGLGDTLGGATDDVKSFLLKKLAGGDNVLFRGSVQLGVDASNSSDLEQDWAGASHRQGRIDGDGDYYIEGRGTAGEYRISFSKKVF